MEVTLILPLPLMLQGLVKRLNAFACFHIILVGPVWSELPCVDVLIPYFLGFSYPSYYFVLMIGPA
jgi:hypothetical protein